MASIFPQFLHHGAADGVTGSCHRYIASEEFHLLVDCGLFQGQEARNSGPAGQEIDFSLECVRALVVTHVHIDHIGRLPYLMAAGFKGPILCSAPSAKLLPLVIEDALKMGFTQDRQTIERFLAEVQKHLLPLAYNTWYPLRNTELLQLKLRLQRAGHILGSAYVELDLRWRASEADNWASHRSVFSGDLGAPHAPLLPAPKPPQRADTLIIESTYGNRVHEDRATRRLRLKALVEKALQDGGTVMIPAFSIGRTQELLYEFEGILHDMKIAPVGASPAGDSKSSPFVGASPAGDLSSVSGLDPKESPAGQAPTPVGSSPHPVGASPAGEKTQTSVQNRVWRGITIVVDSPLAAKFTQVYRELKPFWDEEAMKRVRSGRHPLNFESLLTVDSHEDHLRLVRYLAETRRPAIVIAASGMAAGGRIVNYLKAMLGDPRHNVLFVGYQVPGTPGHEIMKAASAHTSVGASPAGDGRRSLVVGACPAGEQQTPHGHHRLQGRLLRNEGEGDRQQGRLLRNGGEGDRGFPSVALDGERYEIRAGVDYVGGYSAHADQQNLLNFVRGMRHWPQQVRVVHGSDSARREFKRVLENMAREAEKELEVLLPVTSGHHTSSP